MSKVLIDPEELKNLISKAQDFSYSDVSARNTDEVLKALDKAIDIIEDAERSNHFSVIEWHPVTERIGKGYDILLRFDNGNVSPALSDDLDYAIERGAIKWAYLPKE